MPASVSGPFTIGVRNDTSASARARVRHRSKMLADVFLRRRTARKQAAALSEHLLREQHATLHVGMCSGRLGVGRLSEDFAPDRARICNLSRAYASAFLVGALGEAEESCRPTARRAVFIIVNIAAKSPLFGWPTSQYSGGTVEVHRRREPWMPILCSIEPQSAALRFRRRDRPGRP